MGMKGLKGKTIGLDTMIFIYHLEDHPKYSLVTEKLFESIEDSKYVAVTSIITLIEILVKPKMEGNIIAIGDYKDLILTFPNLTVMDINLKIVDTASDLRAKYGIKTPDAIQIAASIVGGAQSFITNDEGLKKIKDINIVLLDELL